MPKVESAVDSALASIGTKVKQFKLPPIKIGVEAEVTSVNYESNGYAWQSAPVQKKANGGFVTNRYAVGGLPNMGDLFVANESGPELVGHIGSRTAVANTDQIVEAVSIGVANAVSAVMGSGRSGASGDVVLMVDGEEIARVINKGGKQMSGRYSPIVMPV
jgi:hypothetical protein